MKLADDWKGKHWLTLVTTWSKSRLYTALAKASRALLACSTFRGTLSDTHGTSDARNPTSTLARGRGRGKKRGRPT